MRKTTATLTVLLAMLGGSGVAVAAPQEPLSVAFVSPVDGEVVTGVVPLRVTVTGSPNSIGFEWSPDGGAVWHPIGTDLDGEDGWTSAWGSAPYTGPAHVRATATGGVTTAMAQVALSVDNSVSVVAVDLRPPVLSPNGDGRQDQTRIRVSVDQSLMLRVRIRREGGGIVREWNTSTSGPEVVVIEWNGRAHGSPVNDGRYRVEALGTDGAGLRGSAEAVAIVDTKAPATTWRSISPEPLADQRRMTFSFRARDRASTIQVELIVLDASGRRVARLRRTMPPGRSRIRWTPKRPAGGRLFPGLYRALLRTRDDAGNHSPVRQRSFRVHRVVAARVFTRVTEAGRRVALTFDDCHVRSAWSRILDVLRQKGVEGTFFCPGQMVRWNLDLARRTVREGHTAASHAWDHSYLAGRGIEYTASRLRADAKAWWDVARVTSAPYFRPPYGAYDRSVVAGAGQAFHPRVMLWDVDTNDWRRPGSSVIADRAVRGSRPGSVVLMHTLDQTAAALPSIIDRLRARGLEPVSLPQLFRAAGLP